MTRPTHPDLAALLTELGLDEEGDGVRLVEVSECPRQGTVARASSPLHLVTLVA